VIQRAAARPAPPIRTVRATPVKAPRELRRHIEHAGIALGPQRSIGGALSEGATIQHTAERQVVPKHPALAREIATIKQRALTKTKERVDAENAKRQAEKHGALNLGFINLTPAVTKLATAHLLPGGNIVSKVLNEAIDLPAQSFLSGALLGSSSRKAIEGEPRQLSQIGKGVLRQLEHPVGSFEEAPLSTALLFAGGENALGRLGGRVARTGVLGDRAAELASTERAPLRLTPGEEIVGRRYNTDPARKAAQVAYEKSLTKLPGALRQADPFQATGWRLKRNLVGGTTKIGRVDRIAAANEDTRRQIVKANTVHPVEALKPKVGEHAVPLIVQRVLRSPATVSEDLAKEAAKLKAAQADLKGSHLKANKANLKNVEALRVDKTFLADPKEAFDAANGYLALQRPLTLALLHGGKLNEDQLRASLFPYAQAHMGATHNGKVLVGRDGEPLSNRAILDHMAAHGVEPPGFISHKTGVAGKGSFYRSTLRQPSLERFHRTGEAFAKGTADHSWEAAVGNIAKQASEAAQLEVRRRTLNRLSFGGPFDTQKAAAAAADNFHATAEGHEIAGALGKVVPIHLGSGQIIEKGHISPVAPTSDVLKQFGLGEHTTPQTSELGKWALVPKNVADRLQQHDNALHTDSGIGRVLQLYQQAFRRAKLNTSMPHIVGVAQEQAIRLAAEQAGVAANRAGAKVSRALQTLAEDDGPLGERFREINATFANRGGLAGAQKATDVTRKADQFQQTSALGYIAHGTEGALKSSVGEKIGAPWRAWKAAVEGSLAHVEHQTRNALLGKALRDSGFIPSYHAVLKQTDEAVQALMKGKMTPNMADHLAESIDNMGGNWNRQTPAVRKAVGKFVPFGLWWLNSMRWLYRLPVTHPIKTAMAAALYEATKEQRGRKGQGFGAASPVPNFLQGSIDTKLPLLGEGKIAPSYYSPGGTLGPELGNTLAEQFAPQLQGIYAAARNENPLTGAKLETAKKRELGALDNILNVVGQTTAGPLPFATQTEKLLTKGGKPYGTANLLTEIDAALGGPSQIKPGTERGWDEVIGKLFSPTRFNFPSKAHGAKGHTGKSDPFTESLRREAREERQSARSLFDESLRQEAREEHRREREGR